MEKIIANKARKSNGFSRWLDEYVFLLVFLLVALIAGAFQPQFYTIMNISNVFRGLATDGFLALGMLIVIRTSGIDLSVGSIVAIAGIFATGLQAQMNFVLAILIALLIGVVWGIINGFLISKFRLQPFIVTLASMSMIRGLVYIYTEQPLSPQPQYYDAFRTIGGGFILDYIPVAAIILIAFAVIVHFFLNYTTWGRTICAIGGNKEAVRLAGINVENHLILAYALSGFLAAIGGVIFASWIGICQPSIGSGFELPAIAAVVIGGGLMSGGAGTVLGTIGGVIALNLIQDILTLYNMSTYPQQIVKGIIILLAVMFPRLKEYVKTRIVSKSLS